MWWSFDWEEKDKKKFSLQFPVIEQHNSARFSSFPCISPGLFHLALLIDKVDKKVAFFYYYYHPVSGPCTIEINC